MTPNNSDQSAMHDELRARLLDVQSQAGKAATQSAYTAAGEKALRMIPELIAALTLPASEAVADVIRNDAGQVYVNWRDGKNMGHFIGAKLFTTPQPAPAAHAGGEAMPVDALRGLLSEVTKTERANRASYAEHMRDGGSGRTHSGRRLADAYGWMREQLTALLSGGAAREE